MYSSLSAMFRPVLVPAVVAARTVRSVVLRRWPWLHRYERLLRFSLVGLSGIGVNSAILWILVKQFGLALLPASMLATEAAVISNFLLNDHWTFQRTVHASAPFQRFLRFNGVAFGGMLITALTLAALAAYTQLHLLIANLLAVGAALAWNYVINSRWTWRAAQPALDHPDLPARPGIRARFDEAAAHARSWAVQGRTTLVPIVAVVASLLALAWVIRATPGGWAAIAALLLGAALVIRPGVTSRKATILLLAAAVGVSMVDYLTWRMEMTNWQSWWISLPLLLAELFGALHTLGLQYTIWPRPEPRIDASDDPSWRPIYIFIPTVDEGSGILEPTLHGAIAARDHYLQQYPLAQITIVVCNDGRVAKAACWQETELLAQRMGVTCITRSVGSGAKAGNIEAARQQIGATGAALVVIFDADQIAEPAFLLKTVPPFADPTIAWVQTGQYYSNLDNPIARWANDQQSLFYQVLCPGKATQNAAFICGTNVVLRALALDEIGGLPQDSVTEDFAASIELHPRWRSIFLTDVLARGLGPMDLKSYFGQQRRWAVGTLGVLRTHWRAIFLPRRAGLSIPQRLQYALACTHYLCGIRDLVYIIAPLIFLLTGIAAVQGATVSAFVWHFLPYWLLSQIAFWHVAWRKTSMRGIIIGFGSFPVLIGSLLTVVLGRRVRFTVTAKARGTASLHEQLRPHLLALVACLIGIGLATWAGLGQAPVFVSMIWVVYTLTMLGGVVWLGLADQRAARAPRHVQERATPRFRFLDLRPAHVVMRRALVGAAAVAIGGFMITPTLFAEPPARFQPRRELGQPYLGVSLPYELLQSRPPELSSQLGMDFAILGRTQVISDQFNRAWADQLAARGDRPWITLLFGDSGKASLESSLPAIANGVHDDALRDWAHDIRAYGKPVYLTILPHVDRNWSLSSAVANSGIPQDVPRAWQHVQAIFREAGADNVAWAWAPADPTQDQLYAPPPETIDIIVLSLISFPNNTWANPTQSLAAVAARHPGTPVFLEISAAGEAGRKAEWLRRVGAAVAADHNVYALIYHEGSPAEHASMAEHAVWSLDSDAQSLNALRDAATQAAVRTSADSQQR